MRVKPCSSENSGFSKKPGKRRLARSTQFSRNLAPGPSAPESRAVPPARRKTRLAADLSAYSLPPAPSNPRTGRTTVVTRRLTPEGDLGKNQPFRGKGNIGAGEGPVKEIRKNAKKPIMTGLFSAPACTVSGATSGPFFQLREHPPDRFGIGPMLLFQDAGGQGLDRISFKHRDLPLQDDRAGVGPFVDEVDRTA